MRRIPLGLVGIATLHCIGAAPVNAQQDTMPVPWRLLTQRPRLDSAFRQAGSVHYPDMLLSARVDGTAQFELFVGADGRVDWRRSRTVASRHDLFTNAIRFDSHEWFAPATVNGRAVSTLVPVYVAWLLPKERDEPKRKVWEAVLDSAGLRIRLGWERLPRDTAAPVDSADVRAVVEAGLRHMIGEALADSSNSGRTICVAWMDARRSLVSNEVLQRLLQIYRRVTDLEHCPPTYASMIDLRDERGRRVEQRPKGVLDPVRVSVAALRMWTESVYIFRGEAALGTGAQDSHCEARRDLRAGPWGVVCEHRGYRVSSRTWLQGKAAAKR